MFFPSRLLLRGLGLLLLGALLVVGGTAASVWWVARDDDRSRSDAIVVLGASQYNGRPSEVFEARLQHAKALFDEGVAPVVVTVGGGAPGDRFTEAQAGATYLSARGVRTVTVGVGRDTLQSLRALSQEFARRHWTSAVLVTDPWHELRSRRIASDLGLRAVTSPARGGPANRSRSVEVRYVFREAAGYLFYRLFHRSSALRTPAA